MLLLKCWINMPFATANMTGKPLLKKKHVKTLFIHCLCVSLNPGEQHKHIRSIISYTNWQHCLLFWGGTKTSRFSHHSGRPARDSNCLLGQAAHIENQQSPLHLVLCPGKCQCGATKLTFPPGLQRPPPSRHKCLPRIKQAHPSPAARVEPAGYALSNRSADL